MDHSHRLAQRFSVRRIAQTPWFWIVAVFAISRLAYYAAGVRFDARPLDGFFQFADPLLLKHRLLETLLYLHVQPPGFNLLAGCVLKLAPESYAPVFHALYLLTGCGIGLLLYSLLRAFNVAPWRSVPLVVLFLVSPGIVLFENFLIYDYLLLALLCLAAWALYDMLRGGGTVPVFLFFTSLVALVYTRSVFQLPYFLLCGVAAAVLTPVRRKLVVALTAVGFVLILGLYLKNWILFGTFNTSTWMGVNSYSIGAHQLSDSEKRHFVQTGVLSPLSMITPPAPISVYRAFLPPLQPTGIPVLDQEVNSTGGQNYNSIAFLKIQELYQKDFRSLIRHYPKCLFRSMVKAWFAYFLPTGDFPFFDLNRPKILAWDRAWNVVVFGQWKDASNRKQLRSLQAQGTGVLGLSLYTGTYLLVGLPLLLVWGSWQLYAAIRRKTWDLPHASVLGFMLFNIIYVTLVSNTLASFENNRYRLPLDGFYLVLLGVAVERIWTRLRAVK